MEHEYSANLSYSTKAIKRYGSGLQSMTQWVDRHILHKLFLVH
jgi:hypothetical protein